MSSTTIPTREQLLEKARAMWSLGDYDRVARASLTPFGPELVQACAIGPGTRVLDVAAGSGNVALAAAQAGADVVAADLTPKLLEDGRRRADELGQPLNWVEADAQDLPFDDASFDVVTSSVGAMFAPDHRAAARELLRVCRAGGVIGLINWPPDGWVAEFFGVLGAHGPERPGPSPLLWGAAAYVRDLFGDAVRGVDARRGTLVSDRFESPAAFAGFYRENFGPVIATYAYVGEDEHRRDALTRDLDVFLERTNRGEPGGNAVYHLEYLRCVARRR